MSFGSDLRAEREKLGVPLSSLAEDTKVPSRNLQALESDDFASLPGGVFQRGIVRSYCRCVGLDEKPWLLRFAEASTVTAAVPAEEDWAEFAENVKRTRRTGASGLGLRWWGIVVMLISLAVLCWAVWHFVVQPHLHGTPSF
ncbi:MAG: helix-turn-helix domain-containing protein [Bryocella sp.]